MAHGYVNVLDMFRDSPQKVLFFGHAGYVLHTVRINYIFLNWCVSAGFRTNHQRYHANVAVLPKNPERVGSFFCRNSFQL